MDKQDKEFIRKILVRTMEKDIIWSCYDILELEDLKKEIEYQIKGLEVAKEEATLQLKMIIEQMKFKGYKKEKILRVADKKKNKINLIKKRLKFAKKNLKRTTKRLNNFPVEKATGWYFLYSRKYFSDNFTVTMLREDRDYRLLVRGYNRTVYSEFTSDAYPKLLTLGILLKRGVAVKTKNDTVYRLD